MSSLDYVDLILGIPYQHQHKSLYDTNHNTYTLFKDGKTYELTSFVVYTPSLLFVNVAVCHVSEPAKGRKQEAIRKSLSARKG